MKRVGAKRYLPIPVELEKIAKVVLDAAFQVHTVLGPGLLESVYESCLVYELRKRQVAVATQVMLPVIYESIQVETGFRLDIYVEPSR